jgi:N-formylglutamate deformylase
LPDLNVGTNSGQSCDARVVDAIEEALKQQTTFTSVIDGRFKGGYITRAYGQPEAGIHAVQLEMCQSAYMNESPPFDYRPELAAQASPVVERMISAALDAARSIRT